MMTSLRPFEVVLGVLGFLVLSSKHIFIYNEETLVVLCFFGFLYTSVRLFGDSITESLNARSASIATELRASLAVKENLCRDLIQEQEARRSAHAAIQALQASTHSELASVQEHRHLGLAATTTQLLQQKLQALVLTQATLQEKFQARVSAGFRGSVLEEFQSSKKTLHPKLIQQSLQDLKM